MDLASVPARYNQLDKMSLVAMWLECLVYGMDTGYIFDLMSRSLPS